MDVPDQLRVILCVDDEPTPLYFRKLVLEKAGFQVITTTSAEEAMKVLSTSSVDLVLSDVLMPQVLGTELARMVKSAYTDLPVVLVSGVNEIPAEAAIADLFISKLEGPVALCDKIHGVLNRLSKTAHSD